MAFKHYSEWLETDPVPVAKIRFEDVKPPEGLVNAAGWEETAQALDKEITRLKAREAKYEAFLSWLSGALIDHGFENSNIAEALDRSKTWRRSKEGPA